MVGYGGRRRHTGRRPRGDLWAELMRRTFGIDVLDCRIRTICDAPGVETFIKAEIARGIE
jgi:hypothetical protein